jgi:cytochrome c oxidase subunit 3
MEEGSLPLYLFAEVQEGFKAHPNPFIRTETITADKQKTVLSREESVLRLSQAAYVVEGLI